LVFTFILAAFLLLLLECEFLAFIFIMIYVGAIAVFFLFSIIMLEPKLTYLSKNKLKYFPIGSVFAFTLLIPILNTLNNFFSETNLIAGAGSFYLNTYQNWYDLIDSTRDIQFTVRLSFISKIILCSALVVYF
jgi:NADH:ubiquinone oxidoreductase subunit 6 (subunit J)